MPVSGIIPPASITTPDPLTPAVGVVSGSAPDPLTPAVGVVSGSAPDSLAPIVPPGGVSAPDPLTPASPTPVVYPPGPSGLSAYELAVENGYEGTVEEWLASLSGGASIPVLEYPPQNAATPEGWHVLDGMTLNGNFVQGLPVVMEQSSPTEAYSGNWAYMDNGMESILYFEEVAVGNSSAGLPSGSLTSSGNGHDNIFVQFHEALLATTGQFAIYQDRLYVNRGTDAAPDWHMDGTNLVLANGSRIVSAGSAGIDIICSSDYTIRWREGQLFYLNYDGMVRKCSLMFSLPSQYDDVSLGYNVGSLWELADGTLYKCVDNTAGYADWVMVADAPEAVTLRLLDVETSLGVVTGNVSALEGNLYDLSLLVDKGSVNQVAVDLSAVNTVEPLNNKCYAYDCQSSGYTTLDVNCATNSWDGSDVGVSLLFTSGTALTLNFIGLSTYLIDATGLAGMWSIDNSAVFGFRLLKASSTRYILTKL